MSEDFDLFEKATSKSQQRLMGAVHAYKKSGTLPKNASFAAKVKGIAGGKGKSKGISGSDAKKFAKTKHEGLPETVKEGFKDWLYDLGITDYSPTLGPDRVRMQDPRPEHMTDKARSEHRVERDYHADDSDWVHRSYEERIGMAQDKANRYKKSLGRGMLKKVKSLGPTRREEPTSWAHDVKRRAFRTVSDAIKGKFSEAANDPFPMGGGRESGYRDLGSIAQEVWAANDIETKRSLVHELIETFKFKKEQERHRRTADRAKTPEQLDFLASSLALADEKVIK